MAVRERAVDGRANAAIVAALADWLEVRAADIVLVHGTKGRWKCVEVAGLDAAALAAKVAAAID